MASDTENWLIHNVTDVTLAFLSELQEDCPAQALLTTSKKERVSRLLSFPPATPDLLSLGAGPGMLSRM